MKSMTKALYGYLLAAIFLEVGGYGENKFATFFRMGITIMILIIERDGDS